jgi:putative transposase
MTPQHSSHHRHSIRLPGYDYAQPSAYFVTICTHDRVCSLGEIADGEMQLNNWGRVAAECWAAIPIHFGHVALDEWVVMPNHVHGLVAISVSFSSANRVDVRVGARQCRAPTVEQFRHPVPGSIPTIIRSFKSAATKRINLMRGATVPSVWQRSYYERIIRNEPELNTIRQYIRQNPVKWALDRDNWVNGRPAATTADEYAREAES